MATLQQGGGYYSNKGNQKQNTMPVADVPVGPLDDNLKFFLANMAYWATAEEVKNWFNQFGTVNHVKIIYDKDGKSKGYGFLYMHTPEGAAAVEQFASSTNYRINLLGRDNVHCTKHDEKKAQASKALHQQNKEHKGMKGGGKFSNRGRGGGRGGQQQHQSYGPPSNVALNGVQYPQHAQQAPTYNQNPAKPVMQHNSQGQNQYGKPMMPVTQQILTYGAPTNNQSPQPATVQMQKPPYGNAAFNNQVYSAQQHPMNAPPISTAPYQQLQGSSVQIPVQGPQDPAIYQQVYSAPAAYSAPSPSHYVMNQAPGQPVAVLPSQQPQMQGVYGANLPLPQTPATSYATQQQPLVMQQNPPHPQNQLLATDPSNPTNSTRVFIENLPPKTIVKNLISYFELTLGSGDGRFNIRSASLEYDSDPKANWCYAHVEFSNPSDATEVIRLADVNGLIFSGRHLMASFDQQYQSPSVPLSSAPMHPPAPPAAQNGNTLVTQPNPGHPLMDPRRTHNPPPPPNHIMGGKAGGGRGFRGGNNNRGGRGAPGSGRNRENRRDRPY